LSDAPVPAQPIRIGEEPLTPETVVACAGAAAVPVELAPAARARIAETHRLADAVAARRAVYGRTTGVGANRIIAAAGDPEGHAMRLLRSHATGLGEELPDDIVRATLLIRLAQLAAGGGGLRPELADALAAALRDGWLPRLHDYGGIGTGDITVLAQLGLALAGEDGGWHRAAPGGEGVGPGDEGVGPGDEGAGAGREQAAAGREQELRGGQVTAGREQAERGGPPRPGIGPGDALPLMSSNAATLAVATLTWGELRELLEASLGVAALTFHALAGNPEAFAEPVGRGRPLPGLVAVAAVLRRLTEGGPPPARLQDPFALRCLPPVAGALDDALAGLRGLLEIELNAAAENPLFADGAAFHHGGFHAAPLALALDTLRLALVPAGALAAARVTALLEPALTGLPPFLAVGEPGSSGLLIAEYAATDALARLRADATPTVLGAAVVSRGVEEHASFAWHGAWQAQRAATRLRTLLALEWVAAERALRMKQQRTPPVLDRARALGAAFDDRREDRVIGHDIAQAEAALTGLARAMRAATAADNA
jgi:histidine ammonia-lyase